MYDILSVVIEAVFILTQAYFMTRFVLELSLPSRVARSASRRKGAAGSLKITLLFLLETAASALINFLPYTEIVRGIIYVLYIASAAALVFVRGASMRICLPPAAAIVAAGTHCAVTELFFGGLEDTYFGIGRFFPLTAVQLLLMLEYEILLRLARGGRILLSKRELALILTIFGISAASVSLSRYARINLFDETLSAVLLCSEACMTAVAAICFSMTVSLNKANTEAEKLRSEKQRYEFGRQYAENVRSQYGEIRRIRHDVKHTYSVIQELILEEKYDKAAEFIRQCTKQSALGEIIIDAGNDFLNAILSSKLGAAKENGIQVLCAVSKGTLPIDDTDLCTLLGNMLDNAIEECMRCGAENRVIEVSVDCSEQLSVSVANTSERGVLAGNENLATVKGDTSLHGFGVKSIRQIAEKYNGSAHFFQDDDMFCCEVTIPRD